MNFRGKDHHVITIKKYSLVDIEVNFERTYCIGFAFTRSEDEPVHGFWSKALQKVINKMGRKFSHVNSVDKSGIFYTIYLNGVVHARKRDKSTQNYLYCHLKVTRQQYADYYNYIAKYIERSVKYDTSALLSWCSPLAYLYRCFYCGETRVFCSDLIVLALVNANIINSSRVPYSKSVSPDILMEILKSSKYYGKDLQYAKKDRLCKNPINMNY